MFKSTWYLLLLTLLWSCSENANYQEALKKVSLESTGEIIRIRLNEETANVSSDVGYLGLDEEGERELIYSLNTFNNSVQLYDLKSGVMADSLVFETEGEHGVGAIASVHIHTMDSIFLFPATKNVLYMTDRKGETMETISYTPPVGYSGAIVSSTFFSAPAIVNYDNIIVKGLFQGNYSGMTNEELASKSLTYTIDLKETETRASAHFFPPDYWEDKTKHYEYSFTQGADRLVYAFYGDHDIYYAASTGERLQKSGARSKYFKRELENLPVGGTREDRRRYFATTPHYGSIVYDPYRQIYYRLCYPGTEPANETDIRLLVRFPGAFTIMILDKDLNVIGETAFLRNTTYVPSNILVSPEGLYLSVNHPDSEENQEAYFSFEHFEIQGL